MDALQNVRPLPVVVDRGDEQTTGGAPLFPMLAPSGRRVSVARTYAPKQGATMSATDRLWTRPTVEEISAELRARIKINQKDAGKADDGRAVFAKALIYLTHQRRG